MVNLLLIHRLVSQACNERPYFGYRQLVIYMYMSQCMKRHTWIKSFLRILHDSYTTESLYCKQPRSAIIKRACENHPHYPRPIYSSSRAKQRIDGRPVAIFLGATHKMDVSSPYQQVPIRWCHINTSLLNCFAILWMNGLKLTRATEYFRQKARVLSRNMKHDKNRSR